MTTPQDLYTQIPSAERKHYVLCWMGNAYYRVGPFSTESDAVNWQTRSKSRLALNTSCIQALLPTQINTPPRFVSAAPDRHRTPADLLKDTFFFTVSFDKTDLIFTGPFDTWAQAHTWKASLNVLDKLNPPVTVGRYPIKILTRNIAVIDPTHLTTSL